jgi:hypothetical protein
LKTACLPDIFIVVFVDFLGFNLIQPLVPVEGGDHAGFDRHGPQPGDTPATISRQAQQDHVVLATLDLLGRLK